MHDRLPAATLSVVLIVAGTLGLILPEVIRATERPPSTEHSMPQYVATKGVEGRFTIAGSNTMYPLVTRLAAEFKRYCPDVLIGVEGQGSKSVSADQESGRGPFWEMVQNKSVYRRGDGSDDGHHVSMQVHVMASSQKLSAKEFQTFQSRYGYEPMEIPIALEAVAVYVHRDNPITGLTLDQVQAIFSDTHRDSTAEGVTTWGQLGLQEGWQNSPIRLYGRDHKSGTRAFFQGQALRSGEFRSTIKEMPGSASLILAVSRDPLGIGYSGIGFQTSSVRPLPLAPGMGGPFVAPTAETATDGSYPLTRQLYLYVNKGPNEVLSPALLEFLKFTNSHEGQETVTRTGVYALPIPTVQHNLSKLTDGGVVAQSYGK